MTPLILSIFPGVDLLGRAFEEEWPEACIVRGPDLIFGGDVRTFHPPAGAFDGVIGGPPCQAFSRLVHIVRAVHGDGAVAENLIPELERVVGEAQPAWWLMENVPAAPLPVVTGYHVHNTVLNNRWFGEEQNRVRRFCFGSRDGLRLTVDGLAPFEAPRWEPAVCSTAGGRRVYVALLANGKPRGHQGRGENARLKKRTLAEECVLQGLPPDFLADAPFTLRGKQMAIGNGVPLPMGRAIARAVRRALEIDTPSEAAQAAT